jgi:hypothetical protein
MTSPWAGRLGSWILVAWKRCLSLRKRDFALEDYPVAIRKHEYDPQFAASRFKQHRYWARVVNWTPMGFGDTRQEAMQDLARSFEKAKAERKQQGKSLPRPGVRQPVAFASQERVNRYPDLADDFIRRILELEGAWISDESSLWDFHTGESNDFLYVRINHVYGVDVSDIESANLSEIFARISERGTRAPASDPCALH